MTRIKTFIACAAIAAPLALLAGDVFMICYPSELFNRHARDFVRNGHIADFLFVSLTLVGIVAALFMATRERRKTWLAVGATTVAIALGSFVLAALVGGATWH